MAHWLHSYGGNLKGVVADYNAEHSFVVSNVAGTCRQMTSDASALQTLPAIPNVTIEYQLRLALKRLVAGGIKCQVYVNSITEPGELDSAITKSGYQHFGVVVAELKKNGFTLTKLRTKHVKLLPRPPLPTTTTTVPPTTTTTTTVPPTTTTVYNPVATVSVTGTGASLNSVTILVGGQETQHTDVALPYSVTIPNGAVGAIYMNAQTADGDAGASVTCTISGQFGTLTTNTSTGPYSVVSCNS